MNSKLPFLCAASLLGCVSAFAQQTAPVTDDRLAALKALKIDDATITLVEHEASPARTVVKLVLRPAKGSNINVEVALPDAEKWNGRFVGLGNGGAAGKINSGSLAGQSAAGYAAVTTDMGTAPNSDSGIDNHEVWKDFGFRATHLMTVVGKQIVRTYYGKAPEFSYFSGGSTGGQQALQEAQRYPEDYDGITAAVPAHCRTPLHAYFLWNDQILKKCPFSKEQEANVIAAANEYMASREIPLSAGKFVSDPRCTAKDIEAVIALARKKDPTLTDEHAAALHKLFDGPRHAVTGERIFNGIPLGATFGPARGNLYLFRWVFGPNKPLEEINFGADIDIYTAALAPYLNAENPNLTAFEKRGGKLIATTGSADSVVPCHATIDYYERVIEHFGSLEKVQSFFRLYLVPGMAHGGGPGVNQSPSVLEAVRTWREQGTAPGTLTGRHVANGKTEWELPLQPYPLKTGWDATTSAFKPVEGPRGGVERVAERFRPPAAE
ncbi:Tannase and feruloyl esterase [Chthoniobacter flavus Ellin428]|uniref:Tannase and feruloyl esterase n=1 Tax=Chthoniobacter flavus Ellin428 TaxID=497964 RepID=B4DCD7_9BACT|nr:tannase/feruloyl esterase family alpha/beta hydrolase [Chthoniobacter flavus]EDY15886.1 Tannase and feruloyl esterase [Chthoniobacter flavus Ellin428]TCO87408.1 tannase/feruloyl esterase [Chthoniobacter flavus]